MMNRLYRAINARGFRNRLGAADKRVRRAHGLAALARGGSPLLAARPPHRRRERRGGLELNSVGSFNCPVYVHGPKGAKGSCSWSSARARSRSEDGDPKGTFLDIKGLVRCCDGERGLFSMAFADWKDSRRFYVYFTDDQATSTSTEFQHRAPTTATRADRSTKRKLLDIEHRRFANHNGGQVQWGPDDLLYIATGDGGGGGDPLENAQDEGQPAGQDPSHRPASTRRESSVRHRARTIPTSARTGSNEISRAASGTRDGSRSTRNRL